MPSKTPAVGLDDATSFIAAQAFSAAGDRGPVGSPLGAHAGIEVEWLTVSLDDPGRPVDFPALQEAASAAGTLPGGSRITYEPGGQLELSSLADHPSGVCQAISEDLAHVRQHLGAAGIGLVGMGLDPQRPERRVVRAPRYAAMERFFNARSPSGRTMMCSTASAQVNLDLGSPEDAEPRWRLLHSVGPALAAAFTNSPFHRSAPSGWRSTRLAAWRELDPSRTVPVPQSVPGPEAWARYALDARVMLIRTSADRYLDLPEQRLTMREWLTSGHPVGWPDLDDLAYHLTTLFPPVRPRGWLEFRAPDSLPDPWWRVPLVIAAALTHDEEAADRARQACLAAEGLWVEAARHGLGHPALAGAARECFTAALEALPRVGTYGFAASVAEAFFDRFVARGRSPADDLLDAWSAHGTLHPLADLALSPTHAPEEPAWT